ncbi:MAG: site-2 protease family protein [Deltaproteobacteria bacterium]|nr:MAG: site-2 protease family protein [Deltaproteobacteria bacterium]
MGILRSPQEAIIWIFAILIAITIHEASHAWMADRLGDPTPRNAGRLTLNPIAHIDPIGAIMFIIARIGWAKPVPINPSYFRKPRRDDFLVSAAGPASNIVTALIMALIFKGLLLWSPPMGHAADTPSALFFATKVAYISVWLNVGLAFFNLIPVPPLDGSGILMSLLPPHMALSYRRIAPYGILILLALFFTGIIGKVLFPIIDSVVGVMLG